MNKSHLFSVPTHLEGSYDDLKDRALAALADGDRRAACQFFDWAYARAKSLGDPELIDKAVCNRAGLAAEFGVGDPLIPELRRIVQTSEDPEAQILGAYNLSQIFAAKDRRSEAKDYAHRAYRAAQRAGTGYSRALCAYRLGLEYLKECRYSRARGLLEQGAELLSGFPNQQEGRALIESTLGYCHSLEGRLGDSRSAMDRSHALVRASSSETYTTDLQLNFGYTLLNMEEYEATAELANRLLSDHSYPEAYKHALFLAGGAYANLGYVGDAEYFFQILQTEFYPEQPMVVDLLLAHPTHQLVNWLA